MNADRIINQRDAIRAAQLFNQSLTSRRKPVSRVKTFGWGMFTGAVSLGLFDWLIW